MKIEEPALYKFCKFLMSKKGKKKVERLLRKYGRKKE